MPFNFISQNMDFNVWYPYAFKVLDRGTHIGNNGMRFGNKIFNVFSPQYDYFIILNIIENLAPNFRTQHWILWLK